MIVRDVTIFPSARLRDRSVRFSSLRRNCVQSNYVVESFFDICFFWHSIAVQAPDSKAQEKRETQGREGGIAWTYWGEGDGVSLDPLQFFFSVSNLGTALLMKRNNTSLTT